MSKIKIGILISGRGSNMQAIIEASKTHVLSADVAVVISNKETAPGLDVAAKNNIPTAVVTLNNYQTKVDYENAISEILIKQQVDLVCLAGYMKILGDKFVKDFEGRLINIHPSLLPAFKGLDAQRQAFDYGVKVAGCTVHFVDETLDGGTIIMQEVVPVLETDTLETMTNNILKKEHQLYPKAIQWVIENRLKIKKEFKK